MPLNIFKTTKEIFMQIFFKSNFKVKLGSKELILLRVLQRLIVNYAKKIKTNIV